MIRSSISYDNINNVSEILANVFNKYTHSHIKDWCIRNNVIHSNATNVLRPQDRNFQKFIDAVTSQNINITQITLKNNTQTYQQIFSNHNMSLVTFIKFILRLSYLLTNLDQTHLEDF